MAGGEGGGAAAALAGGAAGAGLAGGVYVGAAAIVDAPLNGLMSDEDAEVAGLPAEDELIADLEARRADGARFLLVSATALHRLDQRPRVKRHLARGHRLAVEQRHLCRVYELSPVSVKV